MLIRRCVAGDAAAWEEIVETYNRRIYNICYRFAGSGDDAEDLTQEVFIKMYRTLASSAGGPLPQDQTGPDDGLNRCGAIGARGCAAAQ